MVKSLGSEVRWTQADILLVYFPALESVSHFTSLRFTFPIGEIFISRSCSEIILTTVA